MVGRWIRVAGFARGREYTTGWQGVERMSIGRVVEDVYA